MSSKRAPGMIFLSAGHKVIEDCVTKKVAEGAKREPCDITLSDFDDIVYHLTVNDDMNILQLSMNCRIMEDLRMFGGDNMLESEYEGLLVEPEEGYDLSIAVDLDEMPYSPEDIIKKFSELKRNLMGAPFIACFDALLEGTQADLPPIRIDFREAETIYIVPGKESVAIIFSFDFPDPTDAEIGRVFLQEMSEVRRVNGAPPTAFGRDPPREIADMELRERDTCVGYLTFSMQKSHVKGTKLRNSVTLMQGLREYVLYHIKASKTYLHTRMRKQVASLQKVLNRAKPETVKVKKLASGKTFSRK